ncbi:MAG: YdeI/OmpD-associated family protein [Actinomycetota bacterium]
MTSDSLPVISFESGDAWESWLATEHASAAGIWLKIAKKGSSTPTVSYADAVAVALCFGWIDGQKGKLDDDFWLQRFTPRKRGSSWSRINTDKATELIECGRMRPAGQAEVDQARADGRWAAAYASPAVITVPGDLAAELARNPVAQAFFDTLSKGNRYAILYRVTTARRPETRAQRIASYVQMLARHETQYP